MKQADHLKIARAIQKTKDEIRGTKWNGRKSAEEDFYNYLVSTDNPTCADFCEKTGRKKSVWYKYKKQYDDENRLADENHISKWHDTTPDGIEIEFIAE